MKRRAALAALLLLCLPAGGAAQALPADSVVLRLLRERVDSGQAVALAVGLREPDGRHRFVAWSRPGAARPDSLTIFEIGSITKTFTAVLLAAMAERGLVRLDEPVQVLLPDSVRMPVWSGQPITLLDLVTQTSGLPRLPSNMRPANPVDPYADYTVAELYAFLRGHELRRGPGEYEYSNLGFGLLGHALALRGGKPYGELLREQVLAPLGMSNTNVSITPAMAGRLAPAHNAQGRLTSNWRIPTLAGAGALLSNVRDMMRYLDANLRPDTTTVPGRAIARTHAKPWRATGRPNLSIAMGWHVITGQPSAEWPDGRTIIWHNGGTGGYRSFLAFDPATKTGVVVLSNMGGAGVDDLGLRILLNQPAAR